MWGDVSAPWHRFGLPGSLGESENMSYLGIQLGLTISSAEARSVSVQLWAHRDISRLFIDRRGPETRSTRLKKP